MRFSLIHKVSSYLLVTAGFGALALSGELSPSLMLGTLLASALSFFFDPERFSFLRSKIFITAWNVLNIGVAAYFGVAAFRGEPVLIVGIYFLCYLLVNKLWNRRSSRDWLQAYVVSFLMLVAGTTLNTELAFAGCFFVYVVSATWTLTLFHLRREMEENYLLKHTGGDHTERVEVGRILNSRRVVGVSFLAGTSAISLSIFVISGLFFFLFPRVGFNVFFSHGRHGLTVGFDDRGVELGQNGLVKDNDQVVMRVEFPEGLPHGPLYFRGISFDRYRNGRWSPATTSRRRPLKRWADLALVGVPDTARIDRSLIHTRLAGTLRQEVYLEPMDATVLFTAERPVAVAIPSSRPGGPMQPHAEGAFFGEELRDSTGDVYGQGRQGGLRYSVWSRAEPPSDAELLAIPVAPAARLADLENYLDVEGVPAEVLELGRKLTATEVGPYRKARAVLRYLHENYQYTLDLVHDPSKEPVAEFLFDRKRGHCEYFASAMAVLLRAAGIPTRHVAGFYGGEWNDVGHYLQVRQRDAHAWVEVYLGSAGWVPLDPTPSTEGVGQRSALSSRLRQMFDVLELTWFKYVIEYDLTTQIDLISRFRSFAGDWSWSAKPKSKAAQTGGGRKKVVGIVGLAALGALYVWWRRRRAVPGKSRKARRVARRVEAAMNRAIRALERREIRRSPSETLRALARRAAEQKDPGSEAFDELVHLYYEARWGVRTVDEARLEALCRIVRRPPPASARPDGGASHAPRSTKRPDQI